jgi:hypothetical protein
MARTGRIWLFPGPLPGVIQLLVCFVLWRIGFEFEDVTSWVIFLYVFHSSMFVFQAFFPHDYDEFAKDGYWQIVTFNAFIQIVLQTWSSIMVPVFIAKGQFNEKSCEKPHTIPISAIVVSIIEWILLGITVVKINMQRSARKSNQRVQLEVPPSFQSLLQAENSEDQSTQLVLIDFCLV